MIHHDLGIPVIDFTAGREASEEIHRAFRDVGFLYVKNHGVDAGLLDDVFTQSRLFFAQSSERKREIEWTTPESNCGYIGPKVQHLDPTSAGDLMEAYNIGLLQPGAQSFWPPALPEFRDTLLAFYDACAAVCAQLMRAIACSFGLPERFFDAFHDAHYSTARLLHYPAATEHAAGDVRAGAHSDYGTITLLFQDEVGGLEILRDGTWLPAVPLPGTCVVNTGDLMERWTNDVFRSTKHRVVVPSGPAAARSRYSVTFFYRPNVDAPIVCLDPCRTPERPPAHPPTTTRDHLIACLQASYPADRDA